MALSVSGSSAETASLDAAEPQACRKRLRGRLSQRPFRLKAGCCLAPAQSPLTSAMPGELQLVANYSYVSHQGFIRPDVPRPHEFVA